MIEMENSKGTQNSKTRELDIAIPVFSVSISDRNHGSSGSTEELWHDASISSPNFSTRSDGPEIIRYRDAKTRIQYVLILSFMPALSRIADFFSYCR